VPRQTADIVALILAVVVAIVTVATALAVLYIRITHPEQDVVPAAEAIGRIVGVIVAVLAGFLAGRQVDKE
jgi:hypothetical protein